ncbi:helix-turn-helix domain-containing protein [Phenylobacterium deserti]|uniref:Transcriptional regulator n=1 Tax=Phenylobacterium deserti TaxID=1914756 RepID=A0A328ADN2_9CAUL|nr:helix-turn-helix domain-containing protein [Phenylobacterium deserti]RAK52751.1 transcriptional regulator [Phenylobacterium deserti]
MSKRAEVQISPKKATESMDVALGGAIRLRRRSLGLSQDSLARQCGVSFQQIQKYENGANRIPFSRLVQIARALECRVADLLVVLDAGDGAPHSPDLDMLSRLRTPGAIELLGAYEKLSEAARTSLVRLLGQVAAEQQRVGRGP